MCPISFRQDGPPWGPPAFLEPALFRRIIDQFEDLEELHLQGLGEPLMHPEFFALVRYAAARGIRVSTNTNLTLMTSRRARECVESGLDTLHVSIDGATAPTYEFIRRDARFDKVLANLKRLMAAREVRRRRLAAGSVDRLSMRTSGTSPGGREDAAGEQESLAAGRPALIPTVPKVRLVAVAMRRNLDEIPGIVALAADHGVEAVFVQHLCHDFSEGSLPAHYRTMRDFISSQTLLSEDPARVGAAFAEARCIARARGVDLRLPPVDRQESPQSRSPLGCDWPHRGIYLSYRGEAMPCCMVSTPDRIKLGDMAVERVAAVWSGDAYRRFRADLAAGRPPEVCRGCAIYKGTF